MPSICPKRHIIVREQNGGPLVTRFFLSYLFAEQRGRETGGEAI